ncbi:hypothetical protein C6990_05435 [Nitrosopumilus sp. b3]|uniref:hypothetical protein n=1 Tax=Nitrosopumilus sp. b3 TaxID=2109909 RepID=UPI0015F4BDA0|nr:hypothetical protein [Nitrosopumilus sp. b3]KAF6247124.1 hypothetical protein C6990_05435 [Nitrosopumilus sp. b3]
MVELSTIYNVALVGAFLFFLEEIAILLSIYRDNAGWHFRFKRVKGHKNLRPLVATWKIATLLFFLTVFVIPAVGIMFSETLIDFVDSLEYKFLILASGLTAMFFFMWHYIVGMGWNWMQVVLLIASIVCFVLPFVITYYPITA